jgi:hypothetical protein
MTRPALTVIAALFALTAAAQDVAAPDVTADPKQVLLVRVGVGQSLSGPGVSYERLLSKHLAVLVGADASLSRTEGFSCTGGSGELGARWYFFDRPLAGPWVGLSLTGGASESSSRQLALGGLGGLGGLTGVGGLGGLSGVPTEWTHRTLAVGGRLLVGWTFRFDNRLTVQLAAGPSGGLSRTRSTLTTEFGSSDAFTPTLAGSVGLTAFAALGVAL